MLKLTKKPRIFFYHYNKPLSKKMGKPQITVHYMNKCHIVDNVVCENRTYGSIQKSQPYFVMKGLCRRFEVKNGIAYIS